MKTPHERITELEEGLRELLTAATELDDAFGGDCTRAIVVAVDRAHALLGGPSPGRVEPPVRWPEPD